MMNKQLLIAALALVAGASFAQSPAGGPAATPRIDKREARQQQRIDNGVNSGQLTPRETARLEKEQGRIETAEAKARSDGVVSARERAALTRRQDRASRHIRRQKHDAQHDA